ncbi:sensor histidine kinase [Roseateles sp. LKC17W]|uniref:Sensor histidine kinase n=1 Tax=Pelomonas margarita TaxID=3299031 RepID=A0ABW7FKA2_9BURK
MSGPLHAIWRAWRSVRRRELTLFVCVALLFGAIDLSAMLEKRVDGELLPQVLARQFLVPQLTALVLMLCWLPVSRSALQGAARLRGLVGAVLLGALLGVFASTLLMQWLDWPSMCDVVAAQAGKSPCSTFSVAALLGDALWVTLPSLLVFFMMEARARRRRQGEAVQTLLREHAELRRQALASRLATLQAQVEPGLLFDALVSVEQAYARQAGDASERLERLIRHLRVALPRLREAGATLHSEAELIASHLALLRDLHGHPPAFEADLGERSGQCLPPMLLLPLVQRAMRLDMPTRCWLEAGPPLRLRFDRPGLCEEDAELAALRERLTVLGGRLACHSHNGHTEFRLDLP